jgi:uncharacterized protein (DUF1778 family)
MESRGCTYSVRTTLVVIMSATKTARVNLRVAPADDALLRQATELLGETLSEFLIESGRERAELLLADPTRFVLDERRLDGLQRGPGSSGSGQTGAARAVRPLGT